MGEKTGRVHDWDQYWSHGFLTSCANAFPGNYEGRIREIWETFFSSLPHNARILDVATGNGAIALLAAEYGLANDRAFQIHGIDQARINPAVAWKGDAKVLAAVRFHGETAAENSGFPDAFFDAVTGQYALEYTDIDKTLPEITRVAAPGARARFLLHHPESIVIRTSREEQSHGRLIVEQTGLFERAERLLQCIISAQERGTTDLSADPEAETARHALNDAAARLSDAVRASENPDLLSTALGHVREALELRPRAGAAAALSRLRQGEAAIAANLARLDDLLEAVPDDQKLSDIQAIMRSGGWRSSPPETVTYTHDGQSFLMGWLLDFTRP